VRAAGVEDGPLFDLERVTRLVAAASVGTSPAICPHHELPSRQVLPVEEPLETLLQGHVPHLIEVALELFLAGGKTVLLQQIRDHVQIGLATESGDIVGRLRGPDLVVKVGDRGPSLWPPGNA
jgi:hypothetical protein